MPQPPAPDTTPRPASQPAARARPRLAAAAAGVASALLGAGVAELIAGLLTPPAGPLAAVGGTLIDLAPPAAKDAAIALFGTADKPALLVLIGIVLLALGAVAGLLERRRPPLGVLVAALAGIAGAVAGATRPEATPWWAGPSAVGAIVAVIALRMLIALLPAPARGTVPARAGASRRAFLGFAGGAAAAGVLAAALGRITEAGARVVTAARDALRLPAAARPAPPLPAGAELGIPGLDPIVTPNADFYRIDIALFVPRVDPAGWTLRVHGLVEREVELGWDELLSLPLEEHDATLMCVSNLVGGHLVGSARWLGWPVRELLARAGPLPEADMVLSRATDGFSASTPLEALTDPERAALIAIGMNGEPLPAEHGFPVRLVVPGLYGYVSATKWVTELELTRFDAATAYWTDRGWAERGPVKLMSRIDVPRRQAKLLPGPTTIAGMAWHQHVGIEAVEVQLDDGPWRRAELSSPINVDSWRQWTLPWNAVAGEHRVRVRAISASGELQTEAVQGTVPDGATGWHELRFSVAG